MSRAAGLPEGTARLFASSGEVPDEILATAGRGLLIERLLEDGDGDDLRWLATRVAETDLAAWLARVGGRKLSRRSRAYWSLVLGVDSSAPTASAAALWPLA